MERRFVCVVGLDGVPHGLLQRLAAAGVMPRVAEILPRGTLHRVRSALPEVSSVNWSSFMTGENPGRHGVFGFTEFVPGTYRLRHPDFRDVRAPTLWDRLGERGLRSVIVNQPQTYPARPLRGVLIAGFPAPDLARSVYPAGLLRDLRRADYQLDVDTLRASRDPVFLLEEIDRCLRARERAMELLWDREAWDYFQIVVTGTDRLQHFLWDALEDETHPMHAACREYYRRVDHLCGACYDRLARRTGTPGLGFFMLSDHGFAAVRREVYLNRWLRREGYLQFRPGEPSGLEEVSEATRAFALDPGRIYLHRRGRFPRGSVGDEQANALREEIAARLPSLRFEGEPVVAEVHRAEEIYQGPFLPAAPDLVVVARRGFDLKSSLAGTELFGNSALRGMHTHDEAFFWSSDPHGDDLAISALAPVLARACGLPVPS